MGLLQNYLYEYLHTIYFYNYFRFEWVYFKITCMNTHTNKIPQKQIKYYIMLQFANAKQTYYKNILSQMLIINEK